jgi:beta-lactamase regulating signal transducer with metallopeptidase domain
MNSFIENLNQWGGNFLNFAWPMLWQSSLLIALVLALDFLLARKIRAAVRYALWLAVLVKLLLPPALALPTGAAWWLIPAPPVAKISPTKHFTVSYDDAPAQPYIAPQTVSVPAPPVRLELAGWALLASVVVSAGLLAWLALRSWQVARMVRAATAAEQFSEALDEALRLAGVRVARLKIVEGQMSPAVCGLLRPVILLPRELAKKLSPAQLRAVLLHEIFHLRRKDVWLNCAQALLQIFYWWHPLLWVANARIRRVREEAVDDAVMLALRDDAETYAPTLLEVAKLAFQRPLMSLGLVGIMESRSALRQRIERLVDFRAPRKAGLTLASLCGIFVFSAVALPMGEAPVTAEKITAPIVGIVAAEPAQANTNSPQVLIQAEFYRMQFADFQRVASAAKSGATKPGGIENFKQFVQGLKAAGFKPFSRPRVVTNNGVHAQFYVGN